MRSRLRAESGSVTAEFAAVLPAVVLVLACGLGALQLAGEQLRLQAAVDDSARMLGRGDPGASAALVEVAPDARLTVIDRGDLVCPEATAPASLGFLLGFTLRASACSLDDPQ
jgi:hypothetical protein